MTEEAGITQTANLLLRASHGIMWTIKSNLYLRREIREKWEVGPITNHINYSRWAKKKEEKKEGGVGNEIYQLMFWWEWKLSTTIQHLSLLFLSLEAIFLARTAISWGATTNWSLNIMCRDLQNREKEVKTLIEKEDWKAGMRNARSDIKDLG